MCNVIDLWHKICDINSMVTKYSSEIARQGEVIGDKSTENPIL